VIVGNMTTVGVPLVGTLEYAKQTKGNHEGLANKGQPQGIAPTWYVCLCLI